MVSPAPSRVRMVVVLSLVAILLATGTATAQTDDPPVDPPVEEPGPEPEPDAGTSEGEDGEPDETGKKKGKKKAEPECEEQPRKGKKKNGGGADAGAGDDSPAADEDEECTPPRCDEDEVDLAPEEDDPNCIDPARLNRLIANFEAAAAEEATALEDLGAALELLDELTEQLADLRTDLGQVHVQLAHAQVDAEFAQIREHVAAENLEDVSVELASQEDRLRAQAVDAYMGGDDIELAASAAVLNLNNYTEVETARTYAVAVLDDQTTTVGQVDALRDAVVTLTEVVGEIEAATQGERERVLAVEDRVEALIRRHNHLVDQSELRAEAVADEIAEIQRRKQSYADELRITGVGGGAIGQMLSSRQADQEAPVNPFDSLALPLEQTRLGSPFGPRVHPIFMDTRLHAGIDMSGGAGQKILASADGVVVYAEEAGGYGNVVVVDHGNTFATLYAHMTADAVWVGMEVVQGDILGFVGSTGYSTGPHLHYEVRVKGQPVDPMPYLILEEPEG